MCTYTNQELATFYGTSLSTFKRHFSKVKKKFKKTSLGAQYNETDAKQIATLMMFQIPSKELK